jgi:hypothetical protein
MKDETTVDDINKKIANKDQDKAEGIAQGLMDRFGLKVPKLMVCKVHQEEFQGAFIEYMNRDRNASVVCLGCAYKAIDEYIENRK